MLMVKRYSYHRCKGGALHLNMIHPHRELFFANILIKQLFYNLKNQEVILWVGKG